MTSEIVWSNVLTETDVEFDRKLQRVAETIGEGTLTAIADYELQHARGVDRESLGYARLLLKGEQLNYLDREQVAERHEVLNRAIELEPHTGLAHASVASLLSWQLINGISNDVPREESRLQEEARLALKLAPNDPFVLLSVGSTYCRLGLYERGLVLLRRSCGMAPTVHAKDLLARSLCFAGQPEEAIPLFRDILDTMPAGHTFPYARLAVALVQAGRLDEAIEFSSKGVANFPEDYYGWLIHANLLAQTDREGEARDALAQASALVAGLKIEMAIEGTERTYGRTEQQRDWLTAGLRKMLERS